MNNFAKYVIGASIAYALLHLFSQTKTEKNEKRPHRIVFQLTTPDTAAYRALTRQLNNVLAHWPSAELEVVAHNKGIGMLLKDKTNVQPEITALQAKGIHFWACENTLKQQNLDKSQIVSESGFVPVGIAQIVTRQEEGWAYIKAGF
jgi:intracellular sulfur oxidation DsrE/DsrF family protein